MSDIRLTRLSPERPVVRSQLEAAFAAFKDDLKQMCKTKKARDSVTLDPAVEAELWQQSKGHTSELCTYVVRREGDDHIDGIICASICVAGIHERHHEGGPRVSFGKVPHDAEINCKRQRKENMLIDHGTPLADLKADILVWHLWVRPEARGRGWSRRLIEAVVSVAADAIARGYPDIIGRYAGREEEAALYHNFIARLSADVLRFNQKGLDFWRHLLPQATEEHDEDIRLSSVLCTGAWNVNFMRFIDDSWCREYGAWRGGHLIDYGGGLEVIDSNTLEVIDSWWL